MESSSLKQLSVLMATVFVDMIGFLIVLPTLPFYAKHLGARPLVITLLISSFFFAQLLTAPLWGRFSDRYGRRPALLVGLASSAIAFALFGLANTIWLLFLFRLVQGAGGGTTGVVQAYVSDAVPPPSLTGSGITWTTPISFVVGNAQPTISHRLGNAYQADDGNPIMTSDLGGTDYTGSGKTIDPRTGNVSQQVTDASVATVGPPLSVVRTYNSLDPRTSQALGAGWSSVLDMSLVPDSDGTGALILTLADGQQVQQLRAGQPEHRGAPDRAGSHQPAVTQAGQMGRHGGLGQPQFPGQVYHPGRPGGEAAHDGQPGRVGQGPEQRGGGPQRPRLRLGLYHRHRPMISGSDNENDNDPRQDGPRA